MYQQRPVTFWNIVSSSTYHDDFMVIHGYLVVCRESNMLIKGMLFTKAFCLHELL